MSLNELLSLYYFNPFATAPFLVAVMSVVCGYFVFALDRKNGFYQSFLIFSVGISLWLFSQGMLLSTLSFDQAVLFSKIMLVGMVLSVAAVYQLAVTLVYEFSQRKYYVYLLYISGVAVSVFIFTASVFEGVVSTPYGLFPVVNGGFKYFNVFVWLCLMSCYIDLIVYNLRMPKKQERKKTHWFILMLFAFQYSFLDMLEMQNPTVFPVGYIALFGTILALMIFSVRQFKTRVIEQSEEAQKELRTAQLILLESGRNSALASLSAGILHQVSQPVTAIHGFAKFIKQEIKKEDSIYRPISLIEEQAVYMKTLLGDLMEIAEHKEIKKEEVNINGILEKAIHLLTDELHMRQINLDLKLDDNLPLVLVDAVCIQQAFLNIIINALQALSLVSRDNPKNLTITTQYLASEKKITIVFTDTGPGINLLDKMRIFEPFFTTKEKGSGIGLSLTKDLIAEHGGDVDVESLPEQGAKFTVTLPVVLKQEDTLKKGA